MFYVWLESRAKKFPRHARKFFWWGYGAVPIAPLARKFFLELIDADCHCASRVDRDITKKGGGTRLASVVRATAVRKVVCP